MEICVLNPYFYPYKGGTEKVLFEVYRRLAKRHNITVLTSDFGSKCGTTELEGINVKRIRSKSLYIPGAPLNFQSFSNLGGEIRKAAADLYHINNRYQYFYPDISAIPSRSKIALTIHNSLPKNIDILTDTAGLFYDIVWGRRIMKRVDLITGVSRNAIDTTVPNEFSHKSYVVYNGVNYNVLRNRGRNSRRVSSIRRELHIDADHVVVCNGRLVPQKGQRYLIEAMRNLRRRSASLLLIGSGPQESELRRLAQKANIPIAITSGLDDLGLAYHYSAADVAVAPSLYEPASMAALESMSCELPVVASKIGGLPEMVGECGIYAETRNVNQIHDGIKSLFDSRADAIARGRCGRNRVIKRHSWDSIAKRYEELFLNTIRY